MMLWSSIGFIPTRVALVKISLSATSLRNVSWSSRSNRLTVQAGTCLRIFSTVASALAKKESFLAKIEISRMPSSAAVISIAVAAPPEPAMVIFFPMISNPFSRQFLTQPIPSVLWPMSFPFSFTTVFTAPISSAALDSSSQQARAAVLHGMVMLKPFTFNRRSAFTASAVSSSLMS